MYVRALRCGCLLTPRRTTFFVIGFSTFLMSCIDYSKLSSDLAGPNAIERLDDVLIGQCLTRCVAPTSPTTSPRLTYYVQRIVPPHDLHPLGRGGLRVPTRELCVVDPSTS
jgi:hypothetical protein